MADHVEVSRYMMMMMMKYYLVSNWRSKPFNFSLVHVCIKYALLCMYVSFALINNNNNNLKLSRIVQEIRNIWAVPT